jgi:DNA helicase HerA-like ATPase
MLQFRNKNLVVLVVGCSGSGKSTFAIRFLLNGKFVVVFIFDPRGEYALRFNRRAARTVAELHASIGTGFVIFDPHFLYPGDTEKALADFCEFAWHASAKMSGQKILFVDEVWKHCSPNQIPKPLAMVLMDGRKNGIGSLLTTHRPNKLNDAIAGEATELISFSLNGHLKLDYLRKNFDEFPVDELPNLPTLHYVAQNLDSGGIYRGKLTF